MWQHSRDVFYIGGTKVGALFGEAVVITNEELKRDFRYNMKQRGGMLAKGRLLGIQFLTLFEEKRYFEISAHASRLAEKIHDELKDMGVKFYVDSPSNQQFVILRMRCLKVKTILHLNIRRVWTIRIALSASVPAGQPKRKTWRRFLLH